MGKAGTNGNYISNNITSVTINGVESSTSVTSGYTGFYFNNSALTHNCDQIAVTFNMASVPNLSQILFYLNPTCEYNDQDVFSAWIDNIGFFSQTVQTTCATTLKPCTEPTVTIQPSSTQTLCQGTPDFHYFYNRLCAKLSME